MERRLFPGPPNYESIEDGDERDIQWILRLSRPMCVSEAAGDELNSEAKSGITEIQLVIGNSADRRRYVPLIGHRVKVTGTLYSAHTAHHRAAVLLTLKSMEAARPAGTKQSSHR